MKTYISPNNKHYSTTQSIQSTQSTQPLHFCFLTGCDNFYTKRQNQNDPKEEFNPPCSLKNGKESIKMIIRDHADSGSVWNDTFSRALVHALITIDDNGVIVSYI